MFAEEKGRIDAVKRFLSLKIDKERRLNEILIMAAEICQTPTALITFLDEESQYIPYKLGCDLDITSRKDSFCSQAIKGNDLFIVADASIDHFYADNPLVKDYQGIRFYAGAPLTTHDGYNLGCLCVIDYKPRQISESQKRMLQFLSVQVIQILEFEMSIKILKEEFEKSRNSETVLRSFFESSASCHLLLGKDFIVLAYNRALENTILKLFGVQIMEGADIREYVHKSNLISFVENYSLALTGKTVMDKKELTYSGDTIYWSMLYEPAYSSDGEIIGVSYNNTDITDRIKQQKILLAQNESLREIAFIQSHELRRPVSTIMGLMELIKEEDYYTEEREELVMLEKAVNELDVRIRKIVNYTAF